MRVLILFVACLAFFAPQAQTEQDTVAIDSAQFDEVRSLLSFYKYMLNTVGAAKTPTRDKEVIIGESYKKIFNSEQVQIEDDLILDRKVITNKDVNAYLRDVDFFFKEIRFDFDSVQIERVPRGEDDFFYLASFESTLEGVTIEGDTLLDTKRRFMEVNLNKVDRDLKIVSIYNTKTSRTQELQSWWDELSFGWINIFKKYVEFDSVNNDVLLKIASLDSIDISGDQFILNIEPLLALRDLKYVNLSNTKISELSPLRYSRNLETLVATNTPIVDLGTLQYFEDLSSLDLSQSEVEDINVLARLQKLQYLNLSNTKISNFSALGSLSNLLEIDLSNTEFSDTQVLSGNESLKKLDFSRTSITSLDGLSQLQRLRSADLSETSLQSLRGLAAHPSLQILTINQTLVDSLDFLLEAPALQKIYADNSGISESAASAFMVTKPETVVVANSEQVLQWWSNLSDGWKSALAPSLASPDPTKEELAKFFNRDSLDISGKSLSDSSPLKRFRRLRYLNVDKNLFSDFSFTEEMEDLEFLSGVGLLAETSLGLEKNLNLKTLILSESSLKDIRSLSLLNKLELLQVDKTGISEIGASAHVLTNPNTVVIYRSLELKEWWKALSENWKKIFGLENVNSYSLHQLTQERSVTVSGAAISSLKPLEVFLNLEKIELDGVRIANLNELFIHENLIELSCTNGPLQSLDGITKLSKLESLDISNTAIEGLRDLYDLRSLKSLNCAGTGIKNLRGVENLTKMEEINFSSTRVWKLEHLYGMNKLKKVVCNNTRLRSHTVESFQSTFPDCEVVFY